MMIWMKSWDTTKLLEDVEEQHQQELDNDGNWQFKSIIGHQGPLSKNNPNYKDCYCIVAVEWEDGSITHKPLNIFGCDPPKIPP